MCALFIIGSYVFTYRQGRFNVWFYSAHLAHKDQKNEEKTGPRPTSTGSQTYGNWFYYDAE